MIIFHFPNRINQEYTDIRLSNLTSSVLRFDNSVAQFTYVLFRLVISVNFAIITLDAEKMC